MIAGKGLPLSWLLNILYCIGLLIYSPRLFWRYFVLQKNRRGWSQKLFGNVPARVGRRPCVWIHAVSVGEVNLLSGLISELRAARPHFEIAISTSTETGYDLAKQKYAKHNVFFCPMDFSWAVNRTIKQLRPNVLMLTELELWPNLIRGAARQGVPVMVANARLSEKSFRGYQRFKFLFGSSLNSISILAVQNETYANRFRQLGLDESTVIVTGNMKFDNAITDRNNRKSLALGRLINRSQTEKIFIAGSTQAEEDDMSIAVYQRLHLEYPQLKLIVVPRHLERCQRLVQRLTSAGLSYELRSNLTVESPMRPESRVLIVDVIGELGAWWGLADVAYVGGSMGSRGGQNMIEPSAFGVPVCFGPRTSNFRAVVEQLLENDAAKVVENEAELAEFVERCIADPNWPGLVGTRAQEMVVQQQGATRNTVALLFELTNNREIKAVNAA